MIGTLTQKSQIIGRGKNKMIRANTTTTAYNAGTVNIKAAPNRSYFLIQCDASVSLLTLRENNGTGTIKLESKGAYEPWLAPTGVLEIVSDGPFTIASDVQNEA